MEKKERFKNKNVTVPTGVSRVGTDRDIKGNNVVGLKKSG